MPITGLFDTNSVDFAGSLPVTKNGKVYILVAVEHLTGWPIVRAIKDATATTVISFFLEDIIRQFGTP